MMQTLRKTDIQKEISDRAYYDRKWRDSRGRVSLSGRLRCYQILRYVKKFAPRDRSPLAVLDLGCGAGWLTRELVRFGNVTGVDFSSETIRENSNLLPGIRFVCADVADPALPPQLGEFDVVVSSEVAEHIPIAKRDHYFRNLEAFARPGALIVLSTPCFDHLIRLKRAKESLNAFLQRLDGQPINNYFYRQEVLDALGKSFSIVDHTTVQPCVRSRLMDLAWKAFFLPVQYRFLNRLTGLVEFPGIYLVVACKKSSAA